MSFRLPLASTAAALAALGALAAPAQAQETGATASEARKANVTPVVMTPQSVNAAAAFTCSTYSGNFLPDSNSPFGVIYWSNGTEECFGIAPSGTIWHSWPNSGGWKEMPHNGRGVYVYAGYDYPGYGKAIEVMSSTGKFWCSFLDYETNTWGGWYENGSGAC
ncbi:hypothetical protein [Streptomyces acidicola]|uniref:hypothetical protein n=1 Tax=Streptomyces acidicola TaxID=2596892 RepID=UPI00343EF101